VQVGFACRRGESWIAVKLFPIEQSIRTILVR
jgi:hypothetical protein